MSVANELTLTLLKDGSFSCLLHKRDAEEEGGIAWDHSRFSSMRARYKPMGICEDDDPTNIPSA